MPKRKKPISVMTDQELERFVFPKKVREELMRIAHEKDESEDKQSADPSQDKSNT